jgi:hypothetical protein
MMFGARLNIKAKEYSLQEVLVLPRSLQFLGNYKLKTKSLTTNYFTNKTANDIILKKEFNDMLKIFIIHWLMSRGLRKPQDWLWFSKRKIDNFKQHFYVCGPPQFVTAISEALTQLGAKPAAILSLIIVNVIRFSVKCSSLPSLYTNAKRLIFHSDRGAQYARKKFNNVIDSYKMITRSRSRKW